MSYPEMSGVILIFSRTLKHPEYPVCVATKKLYYSTILNQPKLSRVFCSNSGLTPVPKLTYKIFKSKRIKTCKTMSIFSKKIVELDIKSYLKIYISRIWLLNCVLLSQ